ncbi:hypothetical protein HY493_01815 [Candidatus Woesearchaeota archaeon]|nr:hypothetical protein [Candidatus Woesearchaeota archaeon]
MPVISFNFTKISAERSEARPGSTNIKNSVVMNDVVKTSLKLGPQNQDVLRVLFEFTSTYEPDRGKIKLFGEVLYLEKPEKLDTLVKAWQKDKKLPKDEARSIVNHLLSKCNVEAILLSRELNLPSPIELPRLTK